MSLSEELQLIPNLNQHFINIIFENIISLALPLADSTVPDPGPITYDDTNVINYAAGYVCRKIHYSVAHFSKPEKPELLRCVGGLLKVKDDEGKESSSAEWVNEVNRGGLWHVEEGTCMLFAAMEEVRKHFQVGGMEVGKERCRERLIDAVCNEDVLFHWCMLAAESEETQAQIVFDMLVSMWITVRPELIMLIFCLLCYAAAPRYALYMYLYAFVSPAIFGRGHCPNVLAIIQSLSAGSPAVG